MSIPGEPQLLRLRPVPPSLDRRTDALFLSGGDPSHWLAEVCRWGVGTAQVEMKFYILPRAANGVLVVLPDEIQAPVSARAQPYTALLGRVYLPADARLEPPVSEAELGHLCGEGNTIIFHPGAGLCRIPKTDALTLADLLVPPLFSTDNWAGAHPGQLSNAHLRSVRLEMPVELDALFGDTARDIGSETEYPDPPPDEPAAGLLPEAGRRLQEWLARMAAGLASGVPWNEALKSPNWVNRLEDWAGRHLTKLAGDLGAMRHKELHRLMHLLEHNPDAGLRRAIPLTGGLGRRGRAQPGGRLGHRDPNFRIGNLGGGKAADAWDVPPDLQARLRERYRQLANEEARLGRHRRAAYIHAELLGDLSSAAACLKQGEHFHEAAVLYRDHLRQPLDAADCLAAGGEYAEAVVLYEKQNRFLEAAGMYHAMGEEDQAIAAYRRQVGRFAADDDLIAAADLLETKLAAPDEAIALLCKGWPHSQQAGRCLEKAFELLGARGPHAQAASLIAGLAEETPKPAHILPLAQQLATVQETYPDETVRHTARDLARVRVAGRLPAAGSPELRNLLDVLSRLAPGDRLLKRDGNRYLAERLAQEKKRTAAIVTPKAKTATATASRRTPRKTATIKLSSGTSWREARSMGNYFIAAGFNAEREQVELVRSGWDEHDRSELAWRATPLKNIGSALRPLILEVPRDGGTVVLAFADSISAIDALPLTARRFPASNGLWGRSVEGGQPAWWPWEVMAASFAADDHLWLMREVSSENVESKSELLLCCHRRDGSLVSTEELPQLRKAFEAGFRAELDRSHLISVGDCTLVACLQWLVVRQGTSAWKTLEFDSLIIALIPTPPLARGGCAVCLEDGVALLWLDDLSSVQTVITNVRRPLAAFTRSGILVVLSPEESMGQLFEIVRGEAHAVADFDRPGRLPVALIGTVERDGFAVVDEGGSVQTYVY